MSHMNWIPVLSAAVAAIAVYSVRYGLQSAPQVAARFAPQARRNATGQDETAVRAQNPRRGYFLASAMLAAALVYGVAAHLLTPAEPVAPTVAVTAPSVKVSVAAEEHWPATVDIPASVSAVDTANLASRHGGVVTKVLVDAGAHVKKGALLAEVGTADVRAGLAQAQARVDTAKAAYDQSSAQFDRYRTLYEKKIASTAQFELMQRHFLSAKAELDAANLALTAARSDLGYAEIRAPFDGIVAQKNVWPGDYANPGTTLFVIASGTPEIRAEASAETFAALKVGDKAVVVVNGKKLPAVVTRLVDAADPQTRTHLVKLRLEDQRSAPFGAYAELRLNLGKFRALSVPEAALTERAGLVSVFVVGKDHHAHLRLVRVGERADGRVAIMAGLKAGEKVILSPSADLENGSPVSPRGFAVRTGGAGADNG